MNARTPSTDFTIENFIKALKSKYKITNGNSTRKEKKKENYI